MLPPLGARARESIEQSGYVVGGIRYGHDGDIGPDRVLQQSPPAGAYGEPGTRVDLVVNEPE